MKRIVVVSIYISVVVIMALCLQGCVVPFYDEGDRRDHRGPGPGPGPGPSRSAAIRVLSGTYGGNCGAPYGNVTNHLIAVCDGRPACEYIIDYRTLGDPAPNCPKDYVAEWQCGNNPRRIGASVRPEAGTGRIVRLECPVR